MSGLIKAALIGLLLGVALLAGGAALAATTSPSCPSPATDGMLVAPDGITHCNELTLPERYPITAYTFNVDFGNTVGSMGVAQVFNAWADFSMSALATFMLVVGHVLEWTFTFDLISPFAPAAQAEIHNLFAEYYTPLLAGAIACIGLWFFMVATIGHRTRAFQGLGWVGLVLLAATIFAASPVSLLKAGNDASTRLSHDILGSVAVANPNIAGRANDPVLKQGPTGDAALRDFVASVWRTFVFDPYGVAALGSMESGQKYGEELLQKNSGVPGADARFTHDFLDNPQVPQADKDRYNGAQAPLRLFRVLFSMIVAVGFGAGLLILSVRVAFAAAELLVRMIVAPVPLFLGLEPSWGREALLSFARGTVKVLLAKVLAALLIVTVYLLSSTIAHVQPWGLQVFLQELLMVAAVWKGWQILGAVRLAKDERLSSYLKSIKQSRTWRQEAERAETTSTRSRSSDAWKKAETNRQRRAPRARQEAQVEPIVVEQAPTLKEVEAGDAARSGRTRRYVHRGAQVIEGAAASLTAAAPEAAPATVPIALGAGFVASRTADGQAPHARRALPPASTPPPAPNPERAA